MAIGKPGVLIIQQRYLEYSNENYSFAVALLVFSDSYGSK